MYETISHAICTALTPRGVSELCASWPRTRPRQLRLPLCASDEPHAGRLADDAAHRLDALRLDVGDQPPHADAADFLVVGEREVHGSRESAAQELGHEREAGGREALHVGDAATVHLVAARPSASNGSVSHGWPSTGTTSVWPESTTPPVVVLPSRAGSVAHRFALVRSSFERQRRRDAVAAEVVAHPVEQREIRIAAHRREADQPCGSAARRRARRPSGSRRRRPRDGRRRRSRGRSSQRARHDSGQHSTGPTGGPPRRCTRRVTAMRTSKNAADLERRAALVARIASISVRSGRSRPARSRSAAAVADDRSTVPMDRSGDA